MLFQGRVLCRAVGTTAVDWEAAPACAVISSIRAGPAVGSGRRAAVSRHTSQSGSAGAAEPVRAVPATAGTAADCSARESDSA